MKLLFFFLLLGPSFLVGVPWGKDADLAATKIHRERSERRSTPASFIGEKLIRFHQTVISRADGPRSHYVPSSSQYTLEAMRKYGFIKGYLLGCDRLMRENNEQWVYPKTMGPYCELKYDPVR